MTTLKDICIKNEAEKDTIYIHLTDVRANEYDPLSKTLWEGWLKDIPDVYMNYAVIRTSRSLKDNEDEKNGFYLEIKEIPEDSHVNLFKEPMSKQEQLELSDKLDDFLQMYENGFADQLSGDIEEDADYLKYEFKGLYDIVSTLNSRAIDQDSPITQTRIAEKIEEFKERANRPYAWDSDVEKLLQACAYDVDLAVSLILNNHTSKIPPKVRPEVTGFNSHDCETRYKCICCGHRFGSWDVFHQKKGNSSAPYHCPHCKVELDIN